MSEEEVLKRIEKALKDIARKGQRLTGIVYLHRISDLRMPPQPLEHLATFRKLCGDEGLKRVVFVTTMWDDVNKTHARRQAAEDREEELRTNYWKALLTEAQLARHYNDDASIWAIVDKLL